MLMRFTLTTTLDLENRSFIKQFFFTDIASQPEVFGRPFKIMDCLPKAEFIDVFYVMGYLKKGLPLSVLENLAKYMQMNEQRVATLLDLNLRSIHRRKMLHGRLTQAESEKAFRLACIMCKAETIFKNKLLALNWLNRSLPCLKDLAPITLVQSEFGAKEIEKLLNQIEYGLDV